MRKLFVKKELFLIFEIIYIMSVVMIVFLLIKKGFFHEKNGNNFYRDFNEHEQ
jgi:hypothetical protein